MFYTVLHQLIDPRNIGMIIRSHVAFGGSGFIFAGYNPPYKFSKKNKAYSRSLEEHCNPLHFKTNEELFDWLRSSNIKSVAIEISNEAISLPNFSFPDKCAIILGAESGGLPDEIINKCDSVVKIPQFGNIGSMNVAISASIVMYEINRNNTDTNEIIGRMYKYKK